MDSRTTITTAARGSASSTVNAVTSTGRALVTASIGDTVCVQYAVGAIRPRQWDGVLGLAQIGSHQLDLWPAPGGGRRCRCPLSHWQS